MKKTMADRIITFNRGLRYDRPLPEDIRVMNPFVENEWALAASSAFYCKYYGDNRNRVMLAGINPGRFGAGLTGVPFTDPKRLRDRCGIDVYKGESAHEPSSVFVYEVIRQYGGEEAFYGDFYVNSLCPLGFTRKNPGGREVNCNYYDRKDIRESAEPFMLETMPRQIALGLRTDVCFCLGTGKNAAFLRRFNARHGFFGRVVPLEHPRYIMQYKSRKMQDYVDAYLEALRGVA